MGGRNGGAAVAGTTPTTRPETGDSLCPGVAPKATNGTSNTTLHADRQ